MDGAINIKDAYLQIFPPHQCFLHFAVEDNHFQFVVLPFSLVMVPPVFTKVLALVLALLQSKGIHVLGYLDDLHLQKRSALALK